MEYDKHSPDKNKKHADFVGELDPITNILILWMIKEIEPKTLFLRHFPELPEELKKAFHISDRMDVILNYFCGNIEGRFMAGFYISDPRSPKEARIAIADTSYKHDNLFIIYRAIRALNYFSRIEFPDDMIKTTHAFDPSEKDYDKDKMWLMRIINKDRYDEIARDIPPGLEEAVDELLVKGINVDKSPFEAEIKRGLINSDSLMRTLKIPTREEEAKRMARFERIVEPYWEYAVQYFGCKKYPAIESNVSVRLKKYIYEAIARGIGGYVDAVAIAMIMYYREAFIENNKPSGVLDAKSIEMERIKKGEARSRIVRKIADEFAECFKKENKSPEEMFMRYDNYLKNMDIVEPVDLLG